jgi:hypothetical protein
MKPAVLLVVLALTLPVQASVIRLPDSSPDVVHLRVAVGAGVVVDRRVYVWTTSSGSPNATAPAPWDLIGDTLQSFAVDQLEADDAGFVIIPVRRGFLEVPPRSGHWIFDEHMRVTIYVSDFPGCPVPACGAVAILPRTDLSTIGKGKRRSVR